ncbi:multidrug resistance-associated protein 1-like, partial [Saccoglossus kowalevskii]|uniref:Multidrug resistance-associated protein 1-like n=1 Tax=Saccoglossus kowalevskii TaxID=10224 RepID=A0ABM0N0X9_SACKO
MNGFILTVTPSPRAFMAHDGLITYVLQPSQDDMFALADLPGPIPVEFHCARSDSVFSEDSAGMGTVCISVDGVPLLHPAYEKIFTGLLIFIPLVNLVKAISESHNGVHRPSVDYIAPAVLSVTLMLAFVIIQMERLKGVQSSAIMFIFWFLVTLCSTVMFYSKILIAIQEPIDDILGYVTFYLYYVILLIELVLSSISDNPPHYSPRVTDLNPCPYSSASFLSKVTFWWVTRIIVLGYKKPLQREDLWSLNKEDETSHVFHKFEKQWSKEKC